ncbi:ENOS interacting protein [Hypoxylon sp. FL1284]|nr:ENOS interacting protein [Hypoxylon sp. FL1284]
MSHSKRNTSRAVFTSHERDLARRAWGSTSARLSRESFLPLASCGLCLEVARDPVACPRGDIFCRECALGNILAQKKEAKRLDRAREREDREREGEQARREEEARDRAVRDFEMTQIGLDAKARRFDKNGDSSARRRGESGTGADENKEIEDSKAREEGPSSGRKRKFEMDADEMARIAEADRARARRAMDDDERAAKPVLPSFWTPSVTPSSNTRDVLHDVPADGKKASAAKKSMPICPASREGDPHTYSLHTLVTVQFAEEDENGDGGNSKKTKARARVCPACKKGLTNASRAVLAKPCGHVLCGSCVDKFMRPSRQSHHDPHAPAAESGRVRCYVCDADLTEDGGDDREKKGKKKDKDRIRPGLVELRSEGTGFSAGGANQVQKSGIAFQC